MPTRAVPMRNRSHARHANWLCGWCCQASGIWCAGAEPARVRAPSTHVRAWPSQQCSEPCVPCSTTHRPRTTAHQTWMHMSVPGCPSAQKRSWRSRLVIAPVVQARSQWPCSATQQMRSMQQCTTTAAWLTEVTAPWSACSGLERKMPMTLPLSGRN